MTKWINFLLTLMLLGGLLISPSGLLAMQKGEQLPPLPGTLLDGKTFNLGQLEGKPVLLMIGTTWCPGCGTQRKQIEKIRALLAEQGVQYVEVFLREDEAKVGQYFKKNDFQLPDFVFLDQGVISRGLHVRLIPRVLLVDAHAKVYRDGATLSGASLLKEITAMLKENRAE